jgi:hypothetical protein
MRHDIASRTPEGEPNACPICGASVVIEPSLPSGDAPCPCCGVLLWFDDSVTPQVPAAAPIARIRRPLAQLLPPRQISFPVAPSPATIPPPDVTLTDVLGELRDLSRRIAETESSPAHPRLIASALASLRDGLRRVFAPSKPLAPALDSSGVSDPWIA